MFRSGVVHITTMRYVGSRMQLSLNTPDGPQKFYNLQIIKLRNTIKTQ